MNVQEYKRLTAAAARLKTKSDRAAGALEQLMAKLKTDFDCDSLATARELLAAKKEEARVAEEKFDESLKKFDAKWGEKLGE